MKKHNTVKVVLITILVFLLLSWILPAAYYSGQYVDQGRVQMGLYELFNYPLTAISYFGYIGLFIIFVGGFYGILYKIPAYRTFLDKIVAFFEGREKIFLAIVSVLLAFGVSICGLQVAFALFIPFIVALILLMGYDKIVAAMVVVGSMAAGLIGTTYSLTNMNVVLSTLSLDLDYQIGVRFVILIVGIVLVLFNTFMYIKNSMKITKPILKLEKEEKVEVSIEKKPAAKSTSKKPKSSTSSKKTASKTTKSKTTKTRKNANKAALKDNNIIVVKESVTGSDDDFIPANSGNNHKVWPFVAGFTLLFVLLVLAFIAWGDGGFNVKLFDNITKSVVEFKIFKFPIFQKIYGTMNPFGSWTLIDLFLPMGLLLLLLVIIYKVKIDDVFDGFAAGAKKAFSVALVAILIYACLVLVTYHPFQLTIYKALLGIGKGFNLITTIITFILASVFNSDISYVAQSVIPYYTSVVTNVNKYPLVGIIFQSMYGFTALFAPTSLILMGTLVYLKVSYKDWLKNIWKLLLELFLILLIVFIILALV